MLFSLSLFRSERGREDPQATGWAGQSELIVVSARFVCVQAVFMSLFQYEEFAVVETVVRRRVAQVASRHYLFMYNLFTTPIIHMGSQIKWI